MSMNYSAISAMHEDDGIYAFVKRSGLDDRVWVPSIDGVTVAESECMSSISLSRVKAYVEEQCPDGTTWTKVDHPDGVIWEYRATEYEAIAWERRANGARMFVPTRRHYREPDATRTLCGVRIPAKILNPPRSNSIGLSLATMTAAEIAAEPECTRCAARAGGGS